MDQQEENDASEKEKIKSTAIVKYSVPKPAQFIKLKCNTDLNLPPSNWLSSSADSYGLQHVLYHQKGFSSFRMAHMFPDCVGEVDVVSDAENIKKLLKIPYSKGQVSMVVHRVENTLLLDDFDIYKHLLRTSESNWKWLKKFFFDHINHETCEENRNVFIKNRRREALQQKNLVSKFLYHSLVDEETREHSGPDNIQPIPLHGPKLPEPVSATPDSSPFDPNYNRNVVWSFEDIDMLIGTDMPIFGGGTHPCISLRLRDVSKPINVLTGIDYWLDNLMSNVPEVVMCYHLNGIVQKYELIKTEDLPRLDNSKFSPKLIRDVAQSILSFLKSNATKAGHTYWLFKGKDEEVVKLYDLTSLCSEKDVENGRNPFTVPVAMLLYRVARNMKHTSMRQPGTIRMLLKNCINLLPAEEYPEVVTSSHYMLSDLFVPANTNPESPGLETMDVDEAESVYDDDDLEDLDSALKVLALDQKENAKFVNHYKSPPPILGTVDERCLQSINHVAAGLDCLQYFQVQNDKKQQEEEEVPMAKPFEPIPMPYVKLDPEQTPKKKNKRNKKKKGKACDETNDNALLIKNTHEPQPLPTWQEEHSTPKIVWKDHLKTLLYEKAILVYATLSEQNYGGKNYGTSLRTIGLLARCQLVMNKFGNMYSSNALKENCLLGRAGDCCIMMVQNWDKVEMYREQFQSNSDEDLKMMEQLEKDERLYHINIGRSNIKCVFIYDIRTIEQILQKGVECYEEALKSAENDSTLQRLGNNLNELASFYLNKAKMAKTNDCAAEMCRRAEPYLQRGLTVFEKINDEPNMALLYANVGHLHRVLANVATPEERSELTQSEKVEYDKACLNYTKAMGVLGERDKCPAIWDLILWELSTTYYNLACIMLENPYSSLSKIENENRVVDSLEKSLKYCECDENHSKYPLYLYRAGLIHYKMGSLYHNHVRLDPIESTNRKSTINLAKSNYENAAKFFLMAMEVIKYFTCQMEKVALFEFLADGSNSGIYKIKNLQICLNTFIEMNDMFKMLLNLDIFDKSDENNEIDSQEGFKTCFSLLNLVKNRLQHVLKMLVKVCLTKPPITKNCSKLVEVYKSCYQISFELNNTTKYDEIINKLRSVIETIDQKVRDFEKISKN